MCGKMGRSFFRPLQIAMVIHVLTSTVLCNSKKSEPTSDTSNSTSLCNEPPVDFVRQRDTWAKWVCRASTKSEIFKECRKVVDNFDNYYDSCINASCRCDLQGIGGCMCKVIETLAAVCANRSVCVDWRSNELCPKMCPKTKVYVGCKYPCNNTSNATGSCAPIVDECHCPDGTIEVNDECVALKDAPCEYNNRTYKPQERDIINKQSCVCESGKFICIGEPCGTACKPNGKPRNVKESDVGNCGETTGASQ